MHGRFGVMQTIRQLLLAIFSPRSGHEWRVMKPRRSRQTTSM